MADQQLTDSQPSDLEPGSSRFSTDSSPDRFESLLPTNRYTPDIFSGVYKGFKKLPSLKLPQTPSITSLTRPDQSGSGTSTPSHTSRDSSPARSAPQSNEVSTPTLQHATRLVTQGSLDKPLPRDPPGPGPSQYPRRITSRSALRGEIAAHDEPEPPHIRNIESRADTWADVRLETMMESRAEPRLDRSNTGESSSSAASANTLDQQQHSTQDMSSSISSLNSTGRYEGSAREGQTLRANGPTSGSRSPAVNQSRSQTPGPSGAATPGGTSQGNSSHLSGLICNVHRTTGREPHPLVGATTTVLGDKLYVFGGRILSRTRSAPLTSDLYELDLVRRHWSKLETTGDLPPPRYFHSMCALGDTKMVCYGGMSPASNQAQGQDQQQPEVTVMSDVYIYDVPTKKWTYLQAQDSPQGRYAHCACILPSYASFSSHRAPMSSLQHNPSTGNPNEGRIGINIDGTGGAEMVVVGGQDGANRYIEQISVFNLRSLKWTSTQSLGKSCGAYRSVAAPLPPSVSGKIGRAFQNGGSHYQNPRHDPSHSIESKEQGSSTLIYSNYNFLDVKLELQIRSPDGALSERPMSGAYSPPGLRFPNGGVIDTHFVVSGTYLTSSKQEYALWALDLRTLTWSRIDAGGNVFSQGSWNRGVLWNRRNTFVVLGNRKRSLVDDYNHRRINFSNVCMVELEAFGFYDNPRRSSPMSGFISASSPYSGPGLSLTRKAGYTAGGRYHSRASEELGEKALGLRELADMDILCIGGERIPVNSRIVARRWGPYFVQLMREATATQDGSDSITLRSGLSSNPLRVSALTITPSSQGMAAESTTSLGSTGSNSGTTQNTGMTGGSGGTSRGGAGSAGTGIALGDDLNPAAVNTAPTPRTLPPNSRPRCLYLPHTYLTIQALLHFVYTSALPQPPSPLCTPQILCSLLQIARPYRVDGLLESVVDRLHSLLDSRNAAAVFNATAMAAGGGRGIDGSLNPNFFVSNLDPVGSPTSTSDLSLTGTTINGSFTTETQQMSDLNLHNTSAHSPSADELSPTASASGSEPGSSDVGDGENAQRDPRIWNGELSSVIGLQKRGLRGLMEGRRMRERTGTETAGAGMGSGGGHFGGSGSQRVGLGIAGS